MTCVNLVTSYSTIKIIHYAVMIIHVVSWDLGIGDWGLGGGPPNPMKPHE